MAEVPLEIDPRIVVPCTLINTTDIAITLKEDAVQLETKGGSPAPKTLSAGETIEFTMTTGDKLKYSIEGIGDFKIVFDDDKEAPKLKLGDELEGDSPSHGVKTTKTELETETESESKTETEVSWSAGKVLPEMSKSETTKTETETGTLEIETKIETKTKQKKNETKTTVTKKTETKKKETTLVWEFYKV